MPRSTLSPRRTSASGVEIEFLHVLYEQIVANDLRVVAADAGKGPDRERGAVQGHAQGADIGDEDRPLFPAGKSLARHVVDHDAKQNGDADFGGEDEFGQNASAHHKGAGKLVDGLKTCRSLLDGWILIELAHLDPHRRLRLLPVLGALHRPQRQRIEEQRRQEGRADDHQRERQVDAEQEEGGAQATDHGGDGIGEADRDQARRAGIP